MIKRKPKSKETILKNKENIERRNKMFMEIWKNTPHLCQVTGVKLKDPINSMYFHHILPKKKVKEAEFDKENIVLLHPDIHAMVEMDMYKYNEINKKRDFLHIKYNKILGK